jgi:hypothetical protein
MKEGGCDDMPGGSHQHQASDGQVYMDCLEGCLHCQCSLPLGQGRQNVQARKCYDSSAMCAEIPSHSAGHT